MDYYNKYIKYKNKYLLLQQQIMDSNNINKSLQGGGPIINLNELYSLEYKSDIGLKAIMYACNYLKSYIIKSYNFHTNENIKNTYEFDSSKSYDDELNRLKNLDIVFNFNQSKFFPLHFIVFDGSYDDRNELWYASASIIEFYVYIDFNGIYTNKIDNVLKEQLKDSNFTKQYKGNKQNLDNFFKHAADLIYDDYVNMAELIAFTLALQIHKLYNQNIPIIYDNGKCLLKIGHFYKNDRFFPERIDAAIIDNKIFETMRPVMQFYASYKRDERYNNFNEIISTYLHNYIKDQNINLFHKRIVRTLLERETEEEKNERFNGEWLPDKLCSQMKDRRHRTNYSNYLTESSKFKSNINSDNLIFVNNIILLNKQFILYIELNVHIRDKSTKIKKQRPVRRLVKQPVQQQVQQQGQQQNQVKLENIELLQKQQQPIQSIEYKKIIPKNYFEIDEDFCNEIREFLCSTDRKGRGTTYKINNLLNYKTVLNNIIDSKYNITNINSKYYNTHNIKCNINECYFCQINNSYCFIDITYNREIILLPWCCICELLYIVDDNINQLLDYPFYLYYLKYNQNMNDNIFFKEKLNYYQVYKLDNDTLCDLISIPIISNNLDFFNYNEEETQKILFFNKRFCERMRYRILAYYLLINIMKLNNNATILFDNFYTKQNTKGIIIITLKELIYLHTILVTSFANIYDQNVYINLKGKKIFYYDPFKLKEIDNNECIYSTNNRIFDCRYCKWCQNYAYMYIYIDHNNNNYIFPYCGNINKDCNDLSNIEFPKTDINYDSYEKYSLDILFNDNIYVDTRLILLKCHIVYEFINNINNLYYQGCPYILKKKNIEYLNTYTTNTLIFISIDYTNEEYTYVVFEDGINICKNINFLIHIKNHHNLTNIIFKYYFDFLNIIIDNIFNNILSTTGEHHLQDHVDLNQDHVDLNNVIFYFIDWYIIMISNNYHNLIQNEKTNIVFEYIIALFDKILDNIIKYNSKIKYYIIFNIIDLNISIMNSLYPDKDQLLRLLIPLIQNISNNSTIIVDDARQNITSYNMKNNIFNKMSKNIQNKINKYHENILLIRNYEYEKDRELCFEATYAYYQFINSEFNITPNNINLIRVRSLKSLYSNIIYKICIFYHLLIKNNYLQEIFDEFKKLNFICSIIVETIDDKLILFFSKKRSFNIKKLNCYAKLYEIILYINLVLIYNYVVDHELITFLENLKSTLTEIFDDNIKFDIYEKEICKKYEIIDIHIARHFVFSSKALT